ncbi:MAG: hypothetical protein LW628_12690 [Fimbriimonadaceae bacterium]|jgi:hypothetical protein|nr:hypothetical protein [Fimbriimonadaceae bacterium]MCE2767754.1 hypothetical protein [Fimbriimonadaceae bacterium]
MPEILQVAEAIHLRAIGEEGRYDEKSSLQSYFYSCYFALFVARKIRLMAHTTSSIIATVSPEE